VWRGAFNGFLRGSPGAAETRAFRVAWAAVRRAWEPPPSGTGKWRRRARDQVLEPFHVTADGYFSGYAAIWGSESSTGVTFRRGAFDAEMEIKEPGDVPMLRQHDMSRPVGRWVEWRSDARGLWVRGQLALDTEDGREMRALLEHGAVEGLSPGFDIAEGTESDVTAAELFEISLVTNPAEKEAVVDEKNTLVMYDALPLGDVRRTADGYLTTVARVARTGIQVYSGSEVGRPQMDSVRVYRPPEQVFDETAMHSFAHRPVTMDHPREAVTARNWKKYAIGQTGGEIDGSDGKYVQVPLVLMDEAAIKVVEDGKRELSMGYRAELMWDSGVTPDGQKYDAVQTAIRANHLAVCTEARGGHKLRIGDTVGRGDRRMPMDNSTTILVDGVACEVADMAARTIMTKIAAIEQEARELREKMAAAEKKAADNEKRTKDALEEIEKEKKEKETKDAELVALRKQLEDAKITPQKLDQMVADRSVTIAKAVAVLGNKLVVDGKTDGEIRRQVVDAQLGDAAKGWSDESVSAAFTSFTKDVKVDTARPDALAAAIRDARPIHGGGADPRNESYKTYDDALTNAYKNPDAARHQ
jgi:HK97 family phage prohead protease